ncbi:hypothetical protein [Paenibacillus sp. 7523-1]|uniref:hypothetical protein n=1 Tax=Paenibacillus sp. 7523-1 TaxID=2022550 RepID=UPI0015954740|nr:hypothetical protein [Paenibacillus sp. 7523-1]
MDRRDLLYSYEQYFRLGSAARGDLYQTIDGLESGNYIIGGEEFFTNDEGKSYISYLDYAEAFVDIIEIHYVRRRFSVIGA